jgi:hypothetical protein
MTAKFLAQITQTYQNKKALNLQSSIHEVPNLHLGRDIGYPEREFSRLFSALQENAWVVRRLFCCHFL